MINADFYKRHLEEFINNKSPKVKKSVIKAIRNDLEKFSTFLTEKEETGISEQLIDKYVLYMINNSISPSTIKRRLSTMRTYFTYLRKNFGAATPEIETPDFSSLETSSISYAVPETLTPSQTERLYAGILKNNSYLPSGSVVPLAIPSEVLIRREPLVLRNHAIVRLLIGSGITVKELCALNLEDVDTERGFALIRESESPRVIYFGTGVSSALHDYIKGLPLPANLIDMYMIRYAEEFTWCRKNCKSHTIERDLDEKFSSDAGYNSFFRRDMGLLVQAMRRQGRARIADVGPFPALFLSSKGKRLSARMVQNMVSEMVRTYLPDFQGETSAEMLRKTFARRMMEETHGNAAAVMHQMGQNSLPSCAKIDVSNDESIYDAIRRFQG